MAKIFIETPRLILREIISEDVERVFLLDSNPDVMKYIGVKPVTKLEESEETIKKIRKQYQENGIARWAVIEKESNLLIGWSGLKLLTESLNGFQNVYELGYRFLPEYWGKGYATESGKAVLDYGFNKMNLGGIYACVDIQNVDSNKILKDKLGFKEQGTFIDDLDNATCYWYELEKVKFNKD
ncbi:GNAT family N-acetyltransferase [Kaistella flava (ex Peng et al. 2021)]|uniref:GNAT family N-acetyltransferase n=1 Tax=Kaistella flava (ex Peng et al. 2021) TaxID=2038776 RepID=A0A7M2YBY0_9FLAO|nr:GNAT family N-acetyltransferase [Kaistella flava (ex Peng et al. 2021)]QOW11767.1 GNAT family N-acetyltransferase [Kaistella flava (ex Peng et al. 2021)]